VIADGGEIQFLERKLRRFQSIAMAGDAVLIEKRAWLRPSTPARGGLSAVERRRPADARATVPAKAVNERISPEAREGSKGWISVNSILPGQIRSTYDNGRDSAQMNRRGP